MLRVFNDWLLHVLDRMGRSRKRGPLVRAVLWVGFGLCLLAVIKLGDVFLAQIRRLSIPDLVIAIVLLYGSWALSVAAWRQFLVAYTGNSCPWRTALRQNAYLLMGKYFPGGIVGFAARVFDQPDEDRGKLVASGLVEQATGFFVLVATGAILYLVALSGLWWLTFLFVPVIPLAAWGAGYLGHLLMRHVSEGEQADAGRRRALSKASGLCIAQQLVGALFVATVAGATLGTSTQGAVGIAASFALAVAAGMAAIFAPGGIGVREAMLVWLAAPWLDTRDAVALAAALRVVSTLLDLSLGLLAIAFLRPVRQSA